MQRCLTSRQRPIDREAFGAAPTSHAVTVASRDYAPYHRSNYMSLRPRRAARTEPKDAGGVFWRLAGGWRLADEGSRDRESDVMS